MKTTKLNIIIVLGLIATVGILIAQLLWTKEAFSLEEKKFTQKVHIALLEVTKKLYQGSQNSLPNNPVKKIANDYYVVNIENDFSPDALEFYLKKEFARFSLNTDFEYAMYNCQSDEMVYGDYISITNNTKENKTILFPKHKNLIYYFAIRFPNENKFLFSSLKFWFLLSFVLLIILVIYVFSIYTILQQKKYSELQRDFINNMTHEFKTPLSSILLASNFLSKQDAITENEKLKNYTQIIINQSKKLNEHIEKILNIAKTDNDSLALEKKNISIATTIYNVIENVKLKFENLEISVDAAKDFSITADEFHFTNIVYNLIDNSIKYCANVPEIKIAITETKNAIELSFSDNGLGVSTKNIPFIFDKFYREKNKKSNEVNGFGLGLYYVKKICNQHNWKIYAQSNQPSGLTIKILIPKF
ncbi:MAG: HAMP domain-containing sensor histidine kinase [Limnohabitans sp.]|nr:HAMP domain-containing sensor histidine kinase [Limnohabitans sp.]